MGHPRLWAVRPDDDRGPHPQERPAGTGQQYGPVCRARQGAVPDKQLRAGPHRRVGQGLIKQMPVNEAAGRGHILNAAAVQKTAHACGVLDDVALPHVGLAHQHGRDVFGAAHGQAHHGSPFRQQHVRALPGRGAGRAGPGGPRAHYQNIAGYVAHASFSCSRPATSRMVCSRATFSPVWSLN